MNQSQTRGNDDLAYEEYHKKIALADGVIYHELDSATQSAEWIIELGSSRAVADRVTIDVLNAIRCCGSLAGAAAELSIRWRRVVNPGELGMFVRQRIDHLISWNDAPSGKLAQAVTPESFLVSTVLVPAPLVASVASRLSFLHARMLALPLVTLSTVCLVLLSNQGTRGFHPSLSPDLFPASLATVMLLALFHEFGHASALSRFGKPCGAINIGIMAVIPVMFLRADPAYHLPVEQRLTVDFGGVYFQLLAVLPLSLLCLFGVPPLSLWEVSFFVNLALMGLNILPFFRLDGYWILSDWIQIPNLATRSRRLIIGSVARLFGCETSAQGLPRVCGWRRPAMLAYGAASIVLTATILVNIVLWLPSLPAFLHGRLNQLLHAITALCADDPTAGVSAAYALDAVVKLGTALLLVRLVFSRLFSLYGALRNFVLSGLERLKS